LACGRFPDLLEAEDDAEVTSVAVFTTTPEGVTAALMFATPLLPLEKAIQI
jgi:hypothetical protein